MRKKSESLRKIGIKYIGREDPFANGRIEGRNGQQLRRGMLQLPRVTKSEGKLC